MAKSYTAILGISSMATTDDVRSAYRRLVKRYHPDRYAGNSDHFRQVQEAFDVLGNAERRRQYERQIGAAPVIRSSGRTTAGPEPEPLIPRSDAAPPAAIPVATSHPSWPPSLDAVFELLWAVLPIWASLGQGM